MLRHHHDADHNTCIGGTVARPKSSAPDNPAIVQCVARYARDSTLKDQDPKCNCAS